jgi:hypothetical protein
MLYRGVRLKEKIQEVRRSIVDERGCRNTSTLSTSIAIYRPQAELFGGRSDGKFVVRLGKDQQFPVLIGAGDN